MPPSHFNFLILLTILVFLPLTILWAKYSQTLKNYKKTLVLTTFCCAIFGWVWQYLAIKEGIWAYSGKGMVGIWIFGIPLEEHLFNIFVGSLIAQVTLILKQNSIKDIKF